MCPRVLEIYAVRSGSGARNARLAQACELGSSDWPQRLPPCPGVSKEGEVALELGSCLPPLAFSLSSHIPAHSLCGDMLTHYIAEDYAGGGDGACSCARACPVAGAAAAAAAAAAATSTSFANLSAYLGALTRTPQRLARRATAVWSVEQELGEGQWRSGARMHRKLGWSDLVALGVGGMVGAGVFVTAGVAAHRHAGPAVILSFLIAGFSALLSALCYTEFSVQLPAAGGAFSYLRITLGELAAYLTGANLLLEYVISNAAVARTFTSYFATIFGYDSAAWLVKVPAIAGDGWFLLDVPAVVLVGLLTLSICCSTKRSSRLNMAITLVHVGLILLVVVAGFTNGNAANLVKPASDEEPAGFAPFGLRGVLSGAAVVYFSFIGFDAVSTMAEEVRHPRRNMPIGVAGSVLVVTLLYCLMAAAMVLLLPYDEIDVEAPFSSAFKKVAGWSWGSRVVGVGACLGIFSSLMVAMLGQARYLCVMGRSHLVPSWLAKVEEASGTPVRSSVFLGVLTASIAAVVDLSILLDLISIGTLFVFYMVANALIFRRHVIAGLTNPWPTAAFLLCVSVFSAGFVVSWRCWSGSTWAAVVCAAALLTSTVAFRLWVPRVGRPRKQEEGVLFEAPCMPWLATLSIFTNVFLAGSLGGQALRRFVVWCAAALLLYVVYGVHSAHDAEGGNLQIYHRLSSLHASSAPNTTTKQPSTSLTTSDG